MKRRIVACVLGISLCLTGCLGMHRGDNAEETAKGEISYPIDSDVTLEYWIRLPATLQSEVKNYGETAYAEELYKQTGIAVEYVHPTRGQESEALNLLIAAGNLPDIVATDWLSRNPDVMLKNSIIRCLNPYIEDYSPHLKKYLAENPEIDKQVKTDEGKYYCYPFVRSEDKLCSTNGFMVRADWLKEMNLEVPETIDEWHTMLTRFKQKGDMPMAIHMSQVHSFAGGFDTDNTFYLEDGIVKYGPVEDSFLSFLTEMNRWYSEGLLTINAAVIDDDIVLKNIRSGESGVFCGAGGSQMSRYLQMMEDSDTGFDLVAVPFPTKNKGETPQFGRTSAKYSSVACAAISATSEHAELAARLLDYSYSEAGYMLENFGIEGVSYKMENGNPKYTELITDNPDGLTMAEVLPLYARASTEGSFVQDVRYIEQYYAAPQLENALTVWGNNNYAAHRIPQISLREEESKEYSEIMNEVKSYVETSMMRFIMGEKPLDEFESFRETVRSMGIERAIEITQAAVARFNQR